MNLVGAAALAAGFGVLYGPVLSRLAYDWQHDDNYSHGFLIIPLALYFVWERRQQFLDAPARPSAAGLVLLLASLATLVAGTLGAELFLARTSFIGAVAGVVLFLYGWPRLRTVIFPIAFLLLMVPIPAIIFNQIAFPLQLWASKFGEFSLRTASIPVLREGNVIVLANTSLEVAEACSGIRSLVSLLTLGIVLGYFTERRVLARVIIALATIPVAILANGGRVAATGIAAHYYGPSVAEGVFHTFSGWLVFVVSFALLMGIQRTVQWLWPDRMDTAPQPAPVAPPTMVSSS